MTEPKLVCRNLWKVFGPNADRALARLGGGTTPEALAALNLVPAVRDVSISVGEGEIFVIMGLSGSGKSTLVRCLSRLVEPSAGEILFHGRDLLKAGEAEMTRLRRHRMGMVFQNFALLPHLTVLQNVAFPLDIQGIARAEREERARRVIALVGLAGREGFFPRQLSGGQQQRVGIARSLAADPELWFLDEPFSALDPLIRREMQDEFLRLQGKLKKTIVFITHDFDEAIRLADRIAIMKDGAVVQQGTPEEIVLHPATDYVREFTRAVPRAKVVRVGSVMDPAEAPWGAGDAGDGLRGASGADGSPGIPASPAAMPDAFGQTVAPDASGPDLSGTRTPGPDISTSPAATPDSARHPPAPDTFGAHSSGPDMSGPGAEGARPSAAVPLSPRAKVAEVAPLFLAGAEVLPVAEDGRIVGRLTRRAVVDLMLGG